MSNNTPLFDTQGVSEDSPYLEIRKGQTDLKVLGYMARRVLATLHAPDAQTSVSSGTQSLLYLFQEWRGRTHRIALYQPQALLTLKELCFVGFLSKKKQQLDEQIITAIDDVDEQMLVELANISGLLSYSSLQLRDGNWCNLVLFRDTSVKTRLKSSEVHSYAAHKLAPHYYQWIRLHNGTMPDGLSGGSFVLQKTHLYVFSAHQTRPHIQELLYS